MTAQTYSIDFDGYWLDSNKGSISSQSGIYCAYSCVYNVSGNTVSIKKLIYIGESDNVNSRIASHEKYDDCERSGR